MKQPKASIVQPIIEPTLSPRQHLDAALDLPSPYAGEVVLEKDLQFAVQQAVRHGLSIQQLRNEALVAFRTLARALATTACAPCSWFSTRPCCSLR